MKRTIEISEETYQIIKDQLGADSIKDISSYDDMIGRSYFFRSVTYHMVGEVTKIVGSFLQLKKASWIADSGRFMNAIKDGSLNEIEPVGIAFVNIESLVDFFPWNHPLPAKQK